jgi:hypothetical protein
MAQTMMNMFSRKRGFPSHDVSAVGVADNSSVTTDDSKSIHSQQIVVISETTSPSTYPLEDYRTEKRLKKSRRLINKYVRKIGSQADLVLSLDSHGYCYIPFRKFLIILSVPTEEPENVVLNTMIFDLGGLRDDTRARKQVSYMQHREVCLGKRKSLIRLDGNEVFLSSSFSIHCLTYGEMVDRLDDFMETALNANSDLTALNR